jgi:parallel beta-helix repeat protein
MIKTLFTILTAAVLSVILPAEGTAGSKPVPLKKGMVITHSVTIKKANYGLNASGALDHPVITISGNDIVVDFNGAVLMGSNDKKRPDEFYGTGVMISGTGITIKNAVIRGYKIAIMGTHLENSMIDSCDFSYNFRQHLNSTRKWEDLSDWQSYHHNEKDEWARFGAGIYLRDCNNLTIKDNVITGGQCGLMMTSCNKSTVYNNNFSFNSGIGIGLYRSSGNHVMNNKLDWNIRGVSDGYYYRGQDAAAILVYEQSSGNIFAYNSATHSGDGFFLWAGASTMETGKGGCNDNLVYGNDFSFAPTNGVEVTFSRNRIIRNKIEGCDNGIWGGYSYHSLIEGNVFKDNNTAIAIEQGQDNLISGNSFSGGRTAIQLWATPGRKMDGHYDDKDVSSRNYLIKNNSFSSPKSVFSISHSHDISILNNIIRNPSEFIRLDSSVKDLLIRNNGLSVSQKDTLTGAELAPAKIEGARNAMLPEGYLDGRKYMIMTQWGPYDFRSPILWWTKTDSTGKMYFDIEGPSGKWKVKTVKGVDDLSATEGTVPGKLSFHKIPGEPTDVEIVYTGVEVTSPFGKKYAAGATYLFSYKKAWIPENWDVKLFSFDKSTDPLTKQAAFNNLIRSSASLKETRVTELNNSYWNGARIPGSNIATTASSTIDFPKGSYVIGVTGGEMVRLYIDHKLVIDAWDPSKVINDADYHHEVTVTLKGRHTLTVEQAQYGGYGLLYLAIHPESTYQ